MNTKYRFYGNLENNSWNIIERIQLIRDILQRSGLNGDLKGLIAIYNQASLDQYQAGHWRRAYTICLQLLKLMQNISFFHHIDDSPDVTATVLLNLGRLWSALGRYDLACVYFERLLDFPETRLDIILPEVVKSYVIAGAYTEAINYLTQLGVARSITSNPHILRAKALVLTKLECLSDAEILQSRIDPAKIGLPGKYWLLLERATVKLGLGDRKTAQQLHGELASEIELLSLELPETNPLPLLLKLALATNESNTGNFSAALVLASQVSRQSSDNGFDAISLRSKNLLCRLYKYADQTVLENWLKSFELQVQSSRYWFEVMDSWVNLGEIYLYQGKLQEDRKKGIQYLSRVLLDCVLYQPPQVMHLIDRSKRILKNIGTDVDFSVQCFHDDEPSIINEAYITLINLTGDLRLLAKEYV